MSLYSSQNSYGQPSYSQFSQPITHSGYQYQYQQPPIPPPAPVYHHDPISFRRDYTNRLAQLNVNSRPIIQNLSMLAQEYSRFAEIVAQCLQSHIRQVSLPTVQYRDLTLHCRNYVAGWLYTHHSYHVSPPSIMYCSVSPTLSTDTCKMARRVRNTSKIFYTPSLLFCPFHVIVTRSADC